MQGRELGQFVMDFTWYLRNLLLAKTSDDIEDVIDMSSDNLRNLKEEAGLVEPPVIMNELSMEQQNEMIRRNPLYGKIVCRCENVSEQEIIDCMHRPVPATTIKGVKKRVRPGMGRCQGGFCQPYVLRILAQQNGKKKTEICMDEPGSCILVKENRL